MRLQGSFCKKRLQKARPEGLSYIYLVRIPRRFLEKVIWKKRGPKGASCVYSLCGSEELFIKKARPEGFSYHLHIFNLITVWTLLGIYGMLYVHVFWKLQRYHGLFRFVYNLSQLFVYFCLQFRLDRLQSWHLWLLNMPTKAPHLLYCSHSYPASLLWF